MDEQNQLLISLLKAQLLDNEIEEVPTSTLGRLGRTASAALRAGVAINDSRKRVINTDDDQEEIDEEAIIALVTSLAELKGVAMKVGQVLSYSDVALPPKLKAALSVLQTHAKPMSSAQARIIIKKALSDNPDNADEILDSIETTPIAAASIGQVHRARLYNGTIVAVKVQYPNIERAIAADFGPAAVGTRFASLIYRNAKMHNVIEEARTRFLQECNYLCEARGQQRFGFIYKNHPVIIIPEVHINYCARNVLTSTFIDGLYLNDFVATNPSPKVRNSIGQALFEYYVNTLFQHRLYNCDPHPGNFLFRQDGTVAMLDYGCIREFDMSFVAKLSALTIATQNDDRDALNEAFVALGMVKHYRTYDFEAARALTRSLFGPMLQPGIRKIDLEQTHSMRQLIQNKQNLMQLTIPGEFLFLFRVRLGLMSILATLGAEVDWFALEQQYCKMKGIFK
ncbi:MAG: AarF/ABC1/UbiB kinase family protein [Deltaproteobacteria bacterium]|nr:AarF/ABC1/UbiB kinase family protein [Deltaproteobacteria bacterium]